MPRFRKKPITIIAHKWNQNGDHPEDNCEMIYPDPRSITQFEPFLSEGKVVRYFRRPDVSGNAVCGVCWHTYHVHGWIDTLEGGHIVCPGDWIITGVAGEKYPIKDSIFRETYDPVEND